MTSADLVGAIARLSPYRNPCGDAEDAVNNLIAQARGLESSSNTHAVILQMLLDANADSGDTRHGILCSGECAAIRIAITRLREKR